MKKKRGKKKNSPEAVQDPRYNSSIKPLSPQEMEKELSVIEKEINDLKKTSILDINKIATEIASELVKSIIKTETNQSSVSAIVEDVSKKRIKNYL